jgi:2,4-dienoyl-CoA reductase-like NADH-dependent reductase (Old Yellow Enzyme family)
VAVDIFHAKPEKEACTVAGIFEQGVINGMELSNRLVRSATWEGMAEPDGRPTDKLVEYYRELVRGGVGLIITGYAYVRPEGKQLPGKMGMHTDAFEMEYRRMTDAVHELGGKIAVQLVHAGGQTSSEWSGHSPLAPSAVKVDQFPETPKEMSSEDIREVVEAFGKAAGWAKAWGFDAVQLHGAHGYLISEFLSPLTNRRTDEYGGSVENRCRFLMEVYHAVRGAVGNNFPLCIKLNSSDNVAGGMELEDALDAAEKLGAAGIDAIEVSGGTPASGDKTPGRSKIKSPDQEAYHLEQARRIKKVVGCAVMAVGGFRSYEVVQNALGEGGVDYVSMSRPLIWEPGLLKRWQGGDLSPARCVSCNGCFKPGFKEGGIYCVKEKKERKKEGK